jgi:tetratricopeptide (TPR) repeat protein
VRRTAPSAAAGALLALWLLPPALAHPVVDEHLRVLNEKIAAEPDNARLYISRGNVHLDDRETTEALENFDRALELDPALTVAHFLRAQALLVEGRPALAATAARRFVELEPETAKGWKTLARATAAEAAEARRAVPEESLAAFDRFFALATDPRPDDFLERAALQRRAGRSEAAIRGLEAGVARLGALTALLLEALEIERERGALESALGYARRLVESSPQVERWLLESARLEAALGRKAEARASLERARSALEQRPKRTAGAWQSLEREIRRLTNELDAPAGTSQNDEGNGR